MIQCDIIVVGGGHIGLSVSNILAQAGFNVILLEKKAPHYTKKSNDPARLLAISNGSCAIYKKHGMDMDLAAIGQPINGIYTQDQDSDAVVQFNPRHVGFASFGYMIEESDLLSNIHAQCKKTKKLRIITECEKFHITENTDIVEVTLPTQVIRAKLLIAADGKHSEIRRLMGIDIHKTNYHQYGIVCDIKHEENHHGIAVERFLQKGPFAILPKKGGHTSSIVWTIPTEYHNTLSSLPETQLVGLIAKRFDGIFGALELASSIKFFKLDRVLAKKYFKTRVVLVGDALHTLHPLAGQGLNLSLRDVDLLVDKIKERHALGLDIGSSIMLQEFQNERLPDNNIMSEATHFLNSIFAYDFEIIKFARRFGMHFVNECAPLNNALMKYAARGEIYT